MVWNHTSRLLSNFPQTKTFSQSPRALQRQKWPKTIPSIVLTFCTKILYPAKLYWRWKHSHHCMLNSMQELCGLDFYRFLLLLFFSLSLSVSFSLSLSMVFLLFFGAYNYMFYVCVCEFVFIRGNREGTIWHFVSIDRNIKNWLKHKLSLYHLPQHIH